MTLKAYSLTNKVYVERGEAEPLTPGRGWAVYEVFNHKEEFVTVISGYRLRLVATTDEQFQTWSKKELIAYPIMLVEESHGREKAFDGEREDEGDIIDGSPSDGAEVEG